MASREDPKADFASQQKPWLLVTDGEKFHIQNSMFNNKPLPNCYYDVGGEIPEFHGREIGCSYQEWILLIGSYEDGLPEVLINLLTKETIELPLMDFKYDFCILTSSPSDPTCHVVFFNNAEEENGEENENSLIMWQPGDKEYTIKKWYYEIFPSGVRAVVAGKLYLEILQDGRYVVIVVEFKESTYRFKVLQMDGGECESSSEHYFFEYSGELFAVYKIKCGLYSSSLSVIKIFNADLLNKEWVRVQNLGRLAIFIGYETAHAHCAAVDSGIAANSVYFLEEDDHDSYYVYNLEEGTVRMKPILCSMETTEDTELNWIMMQGDPSFPKLRKDHEEIIRQDSEKEGFASQQKPWLLVTDGEKYNIQNSMFNNKSLPNCYYDVGGEIPEFHGRAIGCSYQEWILLIGSYEDGLPEVLVNLLTKETIELPLMDFKYDFCILTSSPSDPTCHVVFFHNAEEEDDEEENGEEDGEEDGEENGEENGEEHDAEEDGEEDEEENGEENDAEEDGEDDGEENGEDSGEEDVEENGEEDLEENENSLIIWKPGDKKFTIKKWDFDIFPDGERTARAVVDGKLFLDMYREADTKFLLVIVEFKESTYRFEVVQMDRGDIDFIGAWHQWFESKQTYFFEYSGELFIVDKIITDYCSYNIVGFTIYKADLLNKKWVRIKNLERLAIFIGYETAHAHSVAVDSGIAANSIYFLEPEDFDSYYVYNLDKGTIRMKPPFCSMARTEDAELHWIMMHGDPSFPKLLKDHQESIRQDSEKENKSSMEHEVEEPWNILYTMLDWIMMVCNPSFPKLIKDDQESIRQDSKIETKSSGEVEQDEVKESWNMVPPELLNSIQLRLFGRDYAVFRGVCKSWQQSSIQDYSLLSSTTFLEQCRSSSSLLMYQEDRTSSIFRFFDPVHRKLYCTRIPELKEAHIQYSRDGWLLVSRCSDRSVFFINPLTQEKIELPRMRRSPSVDFFSFSSPPTCSNCLVVGMNRYGSTIYTLKHGDESWREHQLGYIEIEENGRQFLSHCNVVVLNGLHYFMGENRDMVVINLKNGAAEVQLSDRQNFYSKFSLSESFRREDFLVEIDGAPALVSLSPDGGEISILKWNDTQKVWESMESGVEFGGKDMFLSKRGSFMEKIDDVGGMGNTIFPPMIDDANAGVFYSLATRRYHTFCSGYSSELPYIYSGYSSKLPYDVDKFLDGVWVKPDRKFVGHNNLKWFM